MRKMKLAATALTVLFFAASNPLTAKADTIVVEVSQNVTPESVTAEEINKTEEGDSGEADSSGEAAGPGAAQPSGNENGTNVPETAQQADIGEQVAAYASQFIGNPYVYGGTSLTNGADCSGFVMRVYERFGVSLPRTSRDQGRVGMDVGGIENAQPGDIVSYRGHIGIYGGQNKLINASNAREGITVSPVNYKPILSVRRVL